MKNPLPILFAFFIISCTSTVSSEEQLIRTIEGALAKTLDDPNAYERVAFRIIDTTYYEDGRQDIIKNRTERAEKYQSYIDMGKDFYTKRRDQINDYQRAS